MTTYPQKISFGELRAPASTCWSLLRTCCSHHVEISADQWSDDVRLSDIEPGFVCTACGKRGAEVRPRFFQASSAPAELPWSVRFTDPRQGESRVGINRHNLSLRRVVAE
jgi:hypothetical protein